ncbi:hypothetical protein NDU88_006994 [Pleurodeles waltl]|uniref:Uncharacterized protein n=1 Tax=Pleurodeles waltl TaxID=8319 RepID=A0AAV7TYF6_PLEWA|nr:hypothetical protein NDU88_006994 [Pleurodeles waltl]
MMFVVDQKRHREVVEQTILEFGKSILPKFVDFRRSVSSSAELAGREDVHETRWGGEETAVSSRQQP